jgi:hypothetical protein
MRILVAGLVVSAGSVLVSAQEPSRITAASNVRLRASPSETAAIVGTLPLGTDLLQLDTSGDGAGWTRVRVQKRASDSERVGGAEPLDGWLPTRLTRSLGRARREEVVESIVQERLARTGDAFGSRAELNDFIERARHDTRDPEFGGRLALYSIRALIGALEAVPGRYGRQAPYKDWLAAHASAVGYFDSADRWIVRVDHFWKLHDEYARTASADELAWAAVLYGLPGECEGFVPCYIRWMNALEGEYLRRSALGRHVDEAVARVANATSWQTPVARPFFFDPAKDCSELVQALEPLRAAVAATRAEGVQSVVGRLDKLRSPCGR